MRHVDSEKWEDVFCKEYLRGLVNIDSHENKKKVIKILDSIRSSSTKDNTIM